jgi:hypothetical protein
MSLSISSPFLMVKLIRHELMEDSIKNSYYFFLAKYIGFMVRYSSILAL